MLMQGGCDETMHYYAARVALPDRPRPASFGLAQEHEDIRVLVVPAEHAFAMLDANRIMNATPALCLWWLRHHRARLRQEWSVPMPTELLYRDDAYLPRGERHRAGRGAGRRAAGPHPLLRPGRRPAGRCRLAALGRRRDRRSPRR